MKYEDELEAMLVQLVNRAPSIFDEHETIIIMYNYCIFIDNILPECFSWKYIFKRIYYVMDLFENTWC